MKKILYFVCCGLICFGCMQQPQEPDYDVVQVVDNLVIDENSVPIFPKKAALTTDTARRFSIELPRRCTVDWDNQSVVSVVPEEKIEMVRLDAGDSLPDLAVSDYEFKKQTLAVALEALLQGILIKAKPLFIK